MNDAGHGNLVKDDVIDSNGFDQPDAGFGDGISIVDTEYTSVTGCTIDSNRDWGILIENGGHTTLTGDTLLGNGLGGIHTT